MILFFQLVLKFPETDISLWKLVRARKTEILEIFPEASVMSGSNFHTCTIPGGISIISPSLKEWERSPMVLTPRPQATYDNSQQECECLPICLSGGILT